MSKRKGSPDSNSPVKRRVIKKVTTQKIQTVLDRMSVEGTEKIVGARGHYSSVRERSNADQTSCC